MVLLHAKRRAAVATAPTQVTPIPESGRFELLPDRSGSHKTRVIALRAPRTSATFNDAFGAALVASCLMLERPILPKYAAKARFGKDLSNEQLPPDWAGNRPILCITIFSL
jgi:hypothetical protein